MSDALLQVGLLIALGFLLRRSGFLEPGFWRSFERMVYFVLLPVLVFQVLADATVNSSVALRLSGAVALSILLLALLLVLARRRLGVTGPAFTSVFQGSVRFNSYVALAVIPAVFGKGGLELLALLIAVVVPLVNVLSVLMLAVFAGGPSPTPWRVLRSIVTNPLIVASALGVAANLALPGLPSTLDGALSVLSRAALPSGLMAVGAALVPGEFGAHARGLGVSLVARFALLPAVSYGIGTLLHLPAEALGVLVLFQA
ncbi:MAG: AEC family transporter, partial [Deinococcales bacterium]